MRIMLSLEKNLVVSLLIIALGLGFIIYRKQVSKENIKKDNLASVTQTNSLKQDLPEAERILYYNPNENKSEEAYQDFFDTVNKLALEKGKITINDCKADPLVLKIKLGETFIVENIGKRDINFGIGDERVMVKSGESKSIKANYKNGGGVYGYGCGDPSVNRSTGILLITK